MDSMDYTAIHVQKYESHNLGKHACPHFYNSGMMTEEMPVSERCGVDKGSEWILSVARHRDPLADPVGILRNAETC